MYDPLERSRTLEPIASHGDKRKYYRFRAAKWYGGIVTGDVVACNLLCHFCWAGNKIRSHPEQIGEYYSPEEAFDKLNLIAKKSGFRQMRLSGQEPTIGKEHLLALLKLIDDAGYSFILETNGVLLGAEKEYASSLPEFENLHVRVSLKGANENEFHKLTGAKPEAFELQISALKNLMTSKVSCHPALMASFSSRENLSRLAERLTNINPSLAQELEIEELILYPHVIKRLKKLKIDFGTAHEPDNVPQRLI